MRKLLLFLFFGIFLINLVSASIGELPTQTANTNIVLPQTSDSATFQNISSIILGNKTVIFLNVSMTKTGNDFYYTLNKSYVQSLGKYCVHGYGNDVDDATWQYCFEVTPSGQSGNANIVFFLFIIIAFYLVNIIGFVRGEEWMTILGGMALIALGVYMIRNGIIIYRDWITNYFAYITIGWGAMSTIAASISLMND